MRSLPFFLDIIIPLAIVLFFASQLIVPLWRGRPTFPMLNRNRHQAKAALKDVLERTDVADINKQTRQANQALRKKGKVTR